ncbi:MAG: hypothetical protein OXE94_01540 [Aestuariivita sp.]|nr:hypothetical protein [Aestuariivita sp.]MCY4201527.1 hypothetical protein [Aestuariivita sp.]
MEVYAIFLNEPNETCWDAIQKNWPENHFILTKNLAFIVTNDNITTKQIADKVGIYGSDEKIVGLVFEFGSYNGFNSGDLWEWLGKVKHEQ